MTRRHAALAFVASLAFPPIAAALAQSTIRGDSAPPGDSIFNLSDRWTDQHGKPFELLALRGRLAVVAMGYTNCPDICSAIVADMLWLDAHLPPTLIDKVRFVFASIDPKRDTPTVLKNYADAFGVDQTRWTFLVGEDDSVRDLAAVLGVRFRANDSGGFDHSAIISLLSSEGVIAAQQVGIQASSQDLLTKLEALAGAPN